MSKKITIGKALNLLVALDLTEMDAILLRYVSFLCTRWNIKNLSFVHNIKRSALHNLYEDLLKEGITIEGIVEREIKRSIRDHYTGSCQHQLLVTSENHTEGVLAQLVADHAIDLVIAGNKNELQGTGAMTQKLVRTMEANLLLVPEETRSSLEKILVPTDFSAGSARAFLAARSLVENSEKNIEALHVYGIPSFFFPYIDFEQAVGKTRQHLESRIQQFRKKYGLPDWIRFKYVDKEESSVVEIIEQEAVKGGFDLVVISAKGSNPLTTLFIGSTTNDLLLRIRPMPLMIVK